MGVFDLLWGWYLQIWPNLAANVIWMTPAFVIHHVLMRRHVSREIRAQEGGE